MDLPNIIMHISFLQSFPMVSSLAPPHFPHAISMGEGGKYPKQVSK
jgi:hypothetical protein